MDDPEWIEDDEMLLRELRAAGAADPVPAESEAAVRSSFAWLTLDAELAELMHDSAVQHEGLAGVRGAGGPRLLTFAAGERSLEVEAKGEGAHRRLLGQVVPPAPGEIDVRHREGAVTVAADELGCFVAESVPAGPVSLRWRPGDDPSSSVVTDWVIL